MNPIALIPAIGLALTGLAILAVPGPAKADDYFYYGAVVCRGSMALVRFTDASNDDVPDFSKTPGTVGGALLKLKPVDPSRCKLADGREVVLKHIGLTDSEGHGECGGDESQGFSLWIDGKKIYSQEVWHNHCDFPSSISSIFFDGRRLSECRIKGDVGGTDPEPTCKDVSARLKRPLPETADAGMFKLIRSAPGKEAFCNGLVKDTPPENGSPTGLGANWPARVSWPQVSVRGERYWEMDRGGLDDQKIDFDNDGTIDRAIPIEDSNGYFDGLFWLLAPVGKTDDEVQAIVDKLRDNPEAKTFESVRSEGIRVFAGDQTALEEARYTTLVPFQADGQTFLHGRWVIRRTDLPDDIIVKPDHAGKLDEICAWKAIPAL
jgi:hypothetical protein